MPRKPPRPKLYWVETDDHDEDWFIVARSAREARRFHEEEEGYDRGEARATRVMFLDEGAREGWPTHEELTAYGLTIIRAKQPRVVEYAGRRYVEGGLEYALRGLNDDLFERDGRIVYTLGEEVIRGR